MRPSCPAAHSMDTTWFAVDADGNVGAFNTGEDGALPHDACAGPEGGSFDDWPLHAVLAARALADGTLDLPEDAGGPDPSGHAVLVLAPDPAPEARVTYRDAAGLTYSVTDALGIRTLVLRESAPRVVATREPASAEVLARIKALPRVERVVTSGAIWEWSEEGGDDGLFHFENMDYGEPGAYSRVRAPAAPLRAEALPRELAEAISRLRLETRFADDEKLHLGDHLSDEACETWGETGLYGDPEDEDEDEAAEVAGAPRVLTGLEGVPKPPPGQSPPPRARNAPSPNSAPASSPVIKLIVGLVFVVLIVFVVTRCL